MRDDGYLVVWLLYMFYRYTVVLYTVTLLRSLHSTQTTRFRSYLCQSLVSMFLQLLQSRAPECVVQFFFSLFLSNRAGKYRARLQKDAHHLFRCCTKCWKTWRYSWGKQEVRSLGKMMRLKEKWVRRSSTLCNIVFSCQLPRWCMAQMFFVVAPGASVELDFTGFEKCLSSTQS